MKKIIAYMAAVLLFSACSKDDDGGAVQIPPEEKLLASIGDNNGAELMSFQYNDNKTVKRVTVLQGLAIAIFTYSGETITGIDILGAEEQRVCEFTHNNSGNINGLSINGEEYIVQYNPGANSYYFHKNGDDMEYTVFLNENDDVTKVIEYDNFYDEQENITMYYVEDDTKKGPMLNANSIHPYLIMANADFAYYMSYAATKPQEIISFSDGSFIFENSYDNDGFTKQATITNIEADVMEYNYTQLNN